MREYCPDKWVIVRIVDPTQGKVDKVFGSWYGHFTGPYEWRLSSSITAVKEHNDHYDVLNVSGSVYHCQKGSEGVTLNSEYILKAMKEKFEQTGGTVEVIDIKDIP